MQLCWSPAAAAARKRRKLAQGASLFQEASEEDTDTDKASVSGTQAETQKKVEAGAESETQLKVEAGVEDSGAGPNPSFEHEKGQSASALQFPPPPSGAAASASLSSSPPPLAAAAASPSAAPSPPAPSCPTSSLAASLAAVPASPANPGTDLDRSLALQRAGNELAERSDYAGALAKWAAAVALTPTRAPLHELRAQVLMETGDTWHAVIAATRATELEPGWPEAWVTLARAQLNLGEPEMALESAAQACKLHPGHCDARHELQAAQVLLSRQRQMEHAEAEDAAKLAAGGVPTSGLLVHRRVRVVEGREKQQFGAA